MKSNTLEIKNLSFSYDPEQKNKIFDNFTYTFESNKIYVVTGDNGTGKTTLLNIISGLSLLQKEINDNNFSIQFDKLNLNDKEFDIDSIAYLTQNFENTFFNDTIEKEILFTLNNCETELNHIDIVRFYNFFGYNFDNIKDKSPFNLNYGEQKLLAFFLSIIKKHEILLLDEIDSAFSFIMKNKIINFVKTHYVNVVSKKSIVIIVSHDNYFIDKISDTILDFNKL